MSASPAGRDPAWVARVVECQQALFRSYRALDARDYAAVVAEFSARGVWHRQGVPLAGRDAILRELGQRPVDRLTAHLIHAPVVEPVAANEVRVSYHLTAYSHDAEGLVSEPAPLGAPRLVALQDDRMSADGAGRWLIDERRVRVLFKR